VLYAATRGLRALLLARGEELPRQGLRAMVPVNIRQTNKDGELGNKVSSLFVELPVAEADPGRAYELVCAASEQHKAGDQALASSVLVGLTELAPPAWHVCLAPAVRDPAVQRHHHERSRAARTAVFLWRAAD
jgi:diacylglycerol O-acyltransferase / wax synthase